MMPHHPVVKAGLEIGAISGVLTYWAGVLPAILGVTVTCLTIVYYALAIHYLRKNNK